MCPAAAPTGLYEQHISGDIGAAVKRFWVATHDLDWLRTEGFPLLEGIAQFWASRVECSSGARNQGPCNIGGVISMDERMANVTNECYTNAAARLCLEFCAQAARLLNRTAPPSYEELAQRIPLLQSQEVHLPWARYNGSFGGLPVLMLGFPLDVPISPQLRRADVLYYTQGDRTTYKYAPTGMAQAMAAVALLEVGHVAEALAMFTKVYEDLPEPFFAPIELSASLGYGQANFVTAYGGYLQAILFGFLGLRVRDALFTITPVALPPNVQSLRLRGVRWLQSSLDLAFTNGTTTCASLKESGPFPLLWDGTTHMQIGSAYCVAWLRPAKIVAVA